MFLREVGGRALLEGTVRPCAGSAELSALAGRKPALGINPELVRALAPAGARAVRMLLGTAWAGGNEEMARSYFNVQLPFGLVSWKSSLRTVSRGPSKILSICEMF